MHKTDGYYARSISNGSPSILTETFFVAHFINFLVEKDTPRSRLVQREQLEFLLCFINDTYAINCANKVCNSVINILRASYITKASRYVNTCLRERFSNSL